MVLLDAALAFALTLAALATVVTIVMEIGLRFLGLRRKDQVKLIGELYKKEIEPKLAKIGGRRTDQWSVVCKVLQNPFATKNMACDKARWRLHLGIRSPIYERVSLEHVLKRLLEVDEIKAALESTQADGRKILGELGQKYDEYRSALSTRFRTRAQLASMIIGILLAFYMNIDAVRLFQWYVKNPTATAEVIAKSEEILQNAKRADESLESVPEPQPQAESQAQDAEGEVATTEGQSTTSDQAQEGEAKPDSEKLKLAIQSLQQQKALLAGLELPFGSQYFPYCRAPEDEGPKDGEWISPDPLCQGAKKTGKEKGRQSLTLPTFLEYFAWLIKVLVTGMLIGLGAPFWYDVARRVAKVRQAFGATGSAEQRHSGSDGEGKAEDREELIDRIAKDAIGPAPQGVG